MLQLRPELSDDDDDDDDDKWTADHQRNVQGRLDQATSKIILKYTKNASNSDVISGL